MLKNCRICSSRDLELVLDLGNQPWCNNFLTKSQIGKEKYYPLALVFCNKCSLVQLNYTVKKEIMFSDHTYLSGVTNSLSAHFKNLRDDVIKKFKIKTAKTILDIGSNDGTFLKHFRAIKWEVLGVEPAIRIAKIANKSGIKTLNKFFNFSLAKKINKKFDFINASGVFFHLEELHSVTKGVEYLLKEDGVFIIQFLYMKSIIENTAFDQIYHEHLLYYNLKTLNNLLRIHGLEIFDVKLSNIHGGQMTAYVCKKGKKIKTQNLKKYIRSEISSKINKKETYKKFSNKINLLKKINIDFINKSINQKKIIYGLGAPAKGNTLLNYFGIKKDQIKKLIEINPMRKNLFSPGSHIPIFLENNHKQIPDIYYVLAWNFKEEILKKNQQLIKKGVEFYFPIKVKKKHSMKKAFITGANGFLGRHLVNFLKKKKYNIIFPKSKECNLINEKSLLKYSLRKKYVFDEIYHLAAWTQAGDFCLKYPGDQWIINQKINTNVLDWWKNYQPQAKLIFIGTSCAYAENSDYKEKNYMGGEPTPSLYTYAMTKRMLLQGAISMQNQFGMKWLCLVPSTLYGVNYHQDNRQMHFIFDLIKKIVDGKYNKRNVILWGDGNQKREIINVADFVYALFSLRKKSNEIINIGGGKSFSIKYFSKIISKIVGFDHNNIIYDKTKYVGARNKELDITKVSRYLKKYTHKLTRIEEGLKDVVNWYVKKNY